jgi:hypothetical protein
MNLKNTTEMIKATKKGTSAKFAEAVWKTGIPQKAGWIAEKEADTVKLIPKKIVDMSIEQKAKLSTRKPVEQKAKLSTRKPVEGSLEVPGSSPVESPIEQPKKKAVAPRAGKRGKK